MPHIKVVEYVLLLLPHVLLHRSMSVSGEGCDLDYWQQAAEGSL